MRSLCHALTLCLFCSFVSFSVADEPAPIRDGQQAEIDALIEQLGDVKFSRREKATNRLIQMGYPAMKAVQRHAASSQSREVRYRCEVILKSLREIDFQRRLAAFAANRDSAGDYDLPGWQRYRTLIGGDPRSRAMFVEMQKAEPEVLESLEKGPREAADTLAARAQEIQFLAGQFNQQPTLGSVAALLFVAGDAEVPINQQNYSMLYSLCYQQSFRSAMSSGAHRDLIRKLLGGWIRRGEGWAAYQGMMMAMQYELKEGLIPAEKAIRDGAQAHILQYAILTIAKLGDDTHMKLLESKLDDQVNCGNYRINNKNMPVQARDVALAALLHLTRQDVKKYGYKYVQANTQMVFNPNTTVFETPEQRDKALAMWKQFRAGQNDKQP